MNAAFRFVGRVLSSGGLVEWEDRRDRGQDPPWWMFVVCILGSAVVLYLGLMGGYAVLFGVSEALGAS